MSAGSSEISERIAVLTNAYQEVTDHISRLSSLTSPNTGEARNELASLIHQSLKEGDAELETLTLQTSTLSPTTDPQAALLSRLHKLAESFKSARVSYRKALLHSKKESTLAARRERELLFTRPVSPSSSSILEDENEGTPRSSTPISGAQLYRRPYHTPTKKKDATGDDLLTSASTSVTLALRRTHALMSSELARSHFASETLSQSTETLRQLSTNYSSFDSAIAKSKNLITSLVRKNKSDMWYYQMSLYILVGTIAWLIFRRLLWGPVWLVVWLPLRMVVWSLMGILGTKKEVGFAGGEVESNIVITTATTAITTEEVKMEVEVEEGVKRVKLSSGEEIEVPLEVPLETVEAQEWEDGENHDEL